MIKSSARLTHWIPLIIIILLAGWIRARIDFRSEMIPGINGGYYPLLVRNLLEYGSIRYPDAPLVFWIQSIFSLIIRVLSDCNPDQSVLLASKLFDSVLPSLVCIPVYQMARRSLSNQTGGNLAALAIASFSALYLTFNLILTAEMQKNALAMVWLAFYISQMCKLLEATGRKTWILSGLWLILLLLTHFGTFTVALVFSLIFGVVMGIRMRRHITARQIGTGVVLLVGLGLAAVLFLIRDPGRSERLISFYLNPLRIFEAPYLLVLLSGQQVYQGFLFHHFILMNILAVGGIILIIRNRKNLSGSDFTAAISLAVLSLMLTSPLLGMEWALRYYLMSPLAVALLYIYVCLGGSHILTRRLVTSLFTILTLFSVIFSWEVHRKPAISDEAWADLHQLKDSVAIGANDLVVARHGLEWWTGWVLHCRTGKEYSLRPADWDKYPAIYLLRQKSGNNYPGQQGGGQFAEFPVPVGASLVLANPSFQLYRLPNPGMNQLYTGIMPDLQGEVRSVEGNRLTLFAEGYRRPVIITRGSQFITTSRQAITPGMRADVWGYRKPFSLNLYAERINIYPRQ
jgi:hypothetical protein